MKPNIKELIFTLESYIQHLLGAGDVMFPIAREHGYTANPDMLARGKEIRAKIETLREDVFGCPHYIRQESQAQCSICVKK